MTNRRVRRAWVGQAELVRHAEVRRWLGGCIVDPASAADLTRYLTASFPRFVTTVDLAPDEAGEVMEIGANPYFLTLMLRRLRPYDLRLTNRFGGGGDGEQEIVDADGERHAFTFAEVNAETGRLPAEDASLDGVLFCEILEHMTRDPRRPLEEIHRVLRPGGWVLVTTPNVVSRQNRVRLLRGRNIYGPYSGHGPYGRHNREYTAAELEDLLGSCGFTVQRSFALDGHPPGRASKVLGAVMGPASGSNLYALARRGGAPPGDSPPWLYMNGRPPQG